MREFINIINNLFEAKDESNVLKKTIIDMVKSTQEGTVLNQVLKVLQSSGLDSRIMNVVGTDEDAKGFLKQITDAIIQSDASIEQKDEFLKRFPTGILDVGKLLDGKTHSFAELVGPGFPAELLKDLSVRLTSHGVGPGEVALAIMSPKVKWSGRVEGGGDIIADGKPIEVKTSVSSGGRWINARKAKMKLPKIKEKLEEYTGVDVPDRLNVNAWVDAYRPMLDKAQLDDVVNAMADGTFNAVDNSAYKQALKTGDAKAIIDEHMRTGYENYKAYSKFKGILLMDVPTETAQYFTNYDKMKDLIKVDSVYLYAPQDEMMPKVKLVAGQVPKEKAGSKKAGAETPTTKKGKESNFAQQAASIAGGKAKAKVEPKSTTGVGRTKRK